MDKWNGDSIRSFVGSQSNSVQAPFPDVNLVPKHHFLVHYPSIARMIFHLYEDMVANQEIKGNFLRRSAHVMCNSKNVPHVGLADAVLCKQLLAKRIKIL